MLRAASLAPRVLEQMLDKARHEQPTYGDVGATRTGRPVAGYRHDRYEVRIGGPDAFPRARDGLAGWQAHLGAGARIFPSDPVREGATVLICLGMGPLQVVAPTRILYVIDEENRFGFAYGTLPGHPERGEELFEVEREEGRCTFRITAFSRPDQTLVRLGAPAARRVQVSVTRRYLSSLGRFVRQDHGGSSHTAQTEDDLAVLVYDGDCGFCTTSAQWIAARWPDPAPATAVPWQRLGDGGLERLGLTRDEVARAAWWVEEGRTSGGHLAVARALVADQGGWGLVGRLLLVPPLRWLAAVGYRVIARYRDRLHGGISACKN